MLERHEGLRWGFGGESWWGEKQLERWSET